MRISSLCSSRTPAGRLLFVATLPLLCLALHAQAPTTNQPPAASRADLVELPVLVTDHEHRPVDDLKLDQFRVKIDAAAPIAPVAMRKELEEPLAITVLIDASRDSFHDLSQIGDDLSALVGGPLTAKDSISIYAVDCTVARSLSNAVPEATTLRKAVNDAFAYPKLHDGKNSSACGKSVHLWDDVAIAVSALSHLPGHRILLLVSPGEDHGSKYDWKTVQQYAVDQSVAIFGLRDQRQMDADIDQRNGLSLHRGVNGPSNLPQADVRSASELELLCANAGGLPLSANPLFRKDAIADILFLARSRFILSIPKSAYAPGSSHTVKASLPLLQPYFVTATGATAPYTGQ